MMTIYQALFLDVDGTLLNSVETKNRVFIDSLCEEGIPSFFSDRIISESVALSRIERFKMVWKAYFHQDIPSDNLENLLLKSENNLLKADFEPINGAESFLKTFASEIPIHIVSSANTNEVINSFNRLGWSHYFKSIHADIRSKSKIFDNLITENNYLTYKCLAVGDTENDCEAAIQSGINFWLIHTMPLQKMYPEKDFVGQSPDFISLIKYLKIQ